MAKERMKERKKGGVVGLGLGRGEWKGVLNSPGKQWGGGGG